ncbi:MAG: RNaseH domain-containing protein [Prochloraceae cyanobacterium]
MHIEYPFNNENNFWLYSREPISNEILSVILSYWIDTEFPDKNPDKKKKERDNAKKCLYPDRLIWETQTLNTSLWSQHENGTANIISNSNGFILLPDLVATQLSKPGLEFNLSSEKLQFYRCAPLGGSGSELISWPPLSYAKKEQKYYYSVVLTLKVQTVPFQSYPQLQCDVSIRRWCSVPDTRLLSEGRSSSVYIRSQLNWGNDINHPDYTQYFQVAPIVWKGSARWDNNLAPMLEKLDAKLKHKLIPHTPEQILKDPIAALNVNNIPNIAVTYKDGITPKHEVGKGLPAIDRRQLIEQIALHLKDNWELINFDRFDAVIDEENSAKIFDLPSPDGTSWTMKPLEKKKAETEEKYQARSKKLLQKQELDRDKCQRRAKETEEKYHQRYEKLLQKQKLDRENCQRKEEETEEEYQARSEHKLAEFQAKLNFESQRLRQAILECVGNKLVIEIWYINESTRDALRQAICYCLGVDPNPDNEYKFTSIDLTVTIRLQEISKLADRLDLSDNKPKIKQKKQAIDRRMNEVKEAVEKLPKIEATKAVLIELYGKEHWRKKWQDPKSALRLGFAKQRVDRVSQFITPEQGELIEKFRENAKKEGRDLEKGEENKINKLKEELAQKAISSFLDLLRSLGVQIEPPRISIPQTTLPDPLIYVGLFLVNRTSKTSADGKKQLVPVMVKMRSDSWEILATFNGIDLWIPYQEALRKINTNKAEDILEERENEIKAFIKRSLQSKELRNKDVLLFCDAQNIRRYWQWLQDTKISKKGIVFNTESPQLSKGLRIIRVRNENETPQWYGLHDKNKQLFQLFNEYIELEKTSTNTDGLFINKKNDRLFLSIGKKSPTMTQTKITESKLDKPETLRSYAGILELVIANIQPSDRPEDWAIIAHRLRKMALQYKNTLQVPVVLHLAEKMTEYVLSIDEDESETE